MKKFKFENDNLALHIDFYNINMAYTYWKIGYFKRKSVFECYFRSMPFKQQYVVFSGLERFIYFLYNFKFSKNDIIYLYEKFKYPKKFLNFLFNLKFTGNIKSVLEGEIVFNNEPILQIEGPLIECQILESILLNIIGFHTLISTRAANFFFIVNKKKEVFVEFGLRRGHEISASVWGSRSAYIGGSIGTSNLRAGKLFNIPIIGTHSHSFVQTFGNDYIAFKNYALTHKNCVFLIDTFNVYKSGLPSAIKVAKEFKNKINFLGVRIDSGNILFLSKYIRKYLNKEGFYKTKIYVSNNINIKTILELQKNDAKVDVWCIGTKLITSFEKPALGLIYKLVSIENKSGFMNDVMKISDNYKITFPGKKKVLRFLNIKNNNKNFDLIFLNNEKIKKNIIDFKVKTILKDIFINGKIVYKLPTLLEIKKNFNNNFSLLSEKFKNGIKKYDVFLSKKCLQNQKKIFKKINKNIKFYN